MSKVTIVALLLGAAALSGCVGSGETGPTSSGFNTPSASGVFLDPIANQESFKITEPDGDGYAYRVYGVDYEGYGAQSGLIPGTSVTAPPPSGIVSYSGSFRLAEVIGIYEANGRIYGTAYHNAAPLTLTANFGTGQLNGSSNGLRVNGKISGGTLSGDVNWKGVEGDLTGLIGADRTVGAFHGHNDSTTYAGGFIADAP